MPLKPDDASDRTGQTSDSHAGRDAASSPRAAHSTRRNHAIPLTDRDLGPPPQSASPLPAVAGGGAAVSRATGGAVQVCIADGDQAPLIEQFVRAQPHATLYHSRAWQRALTAAGFGRPIDLLALVGDDVAGVLTVVEYPVAHGPRRLLSLPGTPAGGVLCADPAVTWLLARRANRWAQIRTHADLRVREFCRVRPDTPSTWEDTALDWVRVPARTMIGLAAGRRSHRPDRIERRAFTPDEARTFWISGNDATLRMLRSLATAPRLGLQTAYACLGTVRRALGVWAVNGRGVHVLAFGRQTPRSDQLRLLELAARDGLDRGAVTVDFPVPLQPHPALLHRLNGPEVEFAHERRLDPTPPSARSA